jgi:carbonic anhydrase
MHPKFQLTHVRKYAESHEAFPTIAEAAASGGVSETTLVRKLEDKPVMPSDIGKLTLKVTCVDFRVNPDKFLQTKPEGT